MPVLTESELFNVLWKIIVAPAIGFLVYLFRRQQNAIDQMQKEQNHSVEDFKRRVQQLERDVAIDRVLIDRITDDIKEIKMGIAKINESLSTRQNRRHDDPK